jgi:hypothetical protein
MKGKKSLLVALVLAVALLTASVPVAGFAEANTIHVSGVECAYVLIPAIPEVHGKTLHVTDQIHQNLFISDDPAVFPNGVNTAHLDLTINTVTGQATVFAAAVFQPDGVVGAWEGHGTFLIDLLTGGQKGHAEFHGTGELAGQTLVLDTSSGNPADCPALPGFMSAGRWSGFIVPAEP